MIARGPLDPRMYARLRCVLRRFARDDDGATLVEFGLVTAILLLLVFGIIDFGRLGFAYVMAEKATERAVRAAVVAPPMCTGLPAVNTRATLDLNGAPNGTLCSAAVGICAGQPTVSCRADNGNADAARLFDDIRVLLPTHTTAGNLRIAYSYDPALARLGAAYQPIVSIELADLDFQFVSPLGALAAMASDGQASDLPSAIPFPTMSASSPAEDLR